MADIGRIEFAPACSVCWGGGLTIDNKPCQCGCVRYAPKVQYVMSQESNLETQLRARITELEQLAKEMADALTVAINHYADVGSAHWSQFDVALSRYREVIEEVKCYRKD